MINSILFGSSNASPP